MRYSPIVTLFDASPYTSQFERLGARVVVFSDSTRRQAPDQDERDARTLARFGPWRRGVLWTQRDVPRALGLARLMRQQSIRLVHHNNNPRMNRASILAATWMGIPQVSHVRSWTRYGNADQLLAARPDYFLYMSRAIATHFRDAVGRCARRGSVVYDPFDFGAHSSDPVDARRMRASLGFCDTDRVVANVGRLIGWKGQDDFLVAMAEVVKECPKAKALIVGAPAPDHSGRMYERMLRAIVADRGLSNHVVFTGFRSDVPDLMAASDVVVHSASEPEPFGRVIVEAMAARRPVIATGAGGVLDIITDRETGLLVPCRDPGSMAAAVLHLLNDRAAARRMADRARAMAETRFSASLFSNQLHQIYDHLLQQRRCSMTSGPTWEA